MSPLPRPWRVMRLRERAADYAFALRHEARALLRRTDPHVYRRSAAAAAVLLLPGVFETWRFMEPLAARLAVDGHPVHVVSALGINRRRVLDGAERAARYLEEQDLTGVVLVAHSKGGLIGKTLMLADGGARVAGMVAVATPWEGSVYARLFPPGSAVRHFSPRDPHIVALGRARGVNDRIIAVAPAWDPHIPGTGALPGARRTVRLKGSGHFRVLDDADLVEAVRTAVTELGDEGSFPRVDGA
ncbi:lipase family protein [Georgenia yuyongxinii]|uniref:alpha/beta hydrolase n=1 Tax=Georgenia yuyongxinii TaxID=2589797 RepID=UPI0015D4350C|nr:alpha/beta hydrolase [Georgenia yuyongxinii]